MMTNTQHFINAIQRAQNEEMVIIKNGAPNSEDYIVINQEGSAGYNITIKDNQIIECSCPQNHHRKVICKHMVKVSLEKHINIQQLSTSQEPQLQVI